MGPALIAPTLDDAVLMICNAIARDLAPDGAAAPCDQATAPRSRMSNQLPHASHLK
jgi:hypothetical protein